MAFNFEDWKSGTTEFTARGVEEIASHVTWTRQATSRAWKGREILSNQCDQSDRTSQSQDSALGLAVFLQSSNMASPFANVDEFYAPNVLDLLAMFFILLWIVLALFQLISIATG